MKGKKVPQKTAEKIALEIVGDVYDKILNMQVQIFKLEEALYKNGGLTQDQVRELFPENVQKSIPKTPEFGDF